MGRYYHGDIEGKYMFAVQSSSAANRFGAEGTSNYLNYYFDESHLTTIESELNKMEDAFKKVKTFFDAKDGSSYTDEQVENAGITKEEMNDYADYMLGQKIKECILSNGQCSFDAELY